MTDVFISYKREDRDDARRLAEFIAERGYEVWWDVELLPGDSFADEINEILKNAKAAVVLWTPQSVESPWVKSEAAIAFERRILIPARLRDTSIPAPFNSLQTLDLTSWNSEATDEALTPLLTAIEQKVAAEPISAGPLSKGQIEKVLDKPKHEVEFWTSIAQSGAPSVSEYQLYLDRYGEDASFADLARRRIEVLSSGRTRRKLSEILAVAAVAMGIAVGAFTIAEQTGLLESNGDSPATSTSIDEPDRNVLARHPEVIAKTISTWGGGGSRTTNCVPPLVEKAGFVFVGGELQPGIRHAERVARGCPPAGHCDSHNEYCTTVTRSPACYVNRAWYDWKVSKLSESAGDITYETICY